MPDLITAKSLREKRHEIAKEIRRQADKIHAESRDFTAEEDAAWKKVNADYDKMTGQIAIAERAETVTLEQELPVGDRKVGRDEKRKKKSGSEGGESAVTDEHRALALQGWLRRQTGLPLKEKHVEACRRTGMNPHRRAIDIDLRQGKSGDYREVRRQCGMAAYAKHLEMRSLSAQIPTAGAYTIPEGFVPSMETALLAYANMRGVCDVVRTETGQDLPFPTANDTTNKGALLAENTAPATNVDPSFAQSLIMHAYKYTSKIVLVPVELLEDSAFNLVIWLGDTLGIRIGRIQADHFTTGTGAAQPKGIVNAATLGITFASAAQIAADEIYNLKHSVDPAYRQGASWMFHDQTLLAIKKLKNGVGQYLWQSSLAMGAPDTLDGDPITVNQSMAQIATGNKTMLYGQMRRYKIRDVAKVRMRRLVERYADSDQEGFVLFMRSDGNLLDAGTHPVKYAVHP